MPQVFKTKKGGEAIGIAGVGGLAADGGSVLSIEEAAKTMPELQERDKRGRVVLDKDGKAKPLSGTALTKAAKEWADKYNVDVTTAKDEEIYDSGEELRQLSIRRWEQTYKNLEPVNNDPDELATSGADPAAIAAAPVAGTSDAKED